MGGSKDPICGSAANGLFVHPGCHSRIESDREQAYQKGYLVRQGQNPAEVPVKRGLRWFLFNEDGTVTQSSPVILSG